MTRLARVVIPGLPHHVTQRGIRRLDVFFSDDDYRTYRTLLSDRAEQAEVAIWAYCLMPNHVHLIMTPRHADGLRAALGEAHRRYARAINQRHDWRGHLWQERFFSFVMDEPHLLSCARYVELNPVRAGLVRKAEDWPWSSARAHLAGENDGLVSVAAMLERIDDWRAYLADAPRPAELERLRTHLRTGRPAGSEAFIEQLEATAGRRLRPQRRGRPAKPQQ